MSVGAAAVTVVGMTSTVKGISEVGEGNIWTGVKRAFLGLTATNIGAWGTTFRQKLMKGAVLAGTVKIAVMGAAELVNGWKGRGAVQTVKGAVRAALGLASTAYVAAMDEKTVAIVHQATLLALTSGYVLCLGVKDMANRKYIKAGCEILLGGSGVACLAYYIFQEFVSPYLLNKELSAWIETCDVDIAYIRKHGSVSLSGEWKKVGQGISKLAAEHPDIPGYLVKIPYNDQPIRREFDSDARAHHTYLQEARGFLEAEQFKHIVIPESYLVETAHGPIVIEQRFDLIDDVKVPNGPLKDKAEEELAVFSYISGLCDVGVGHNAGFLKGSETGEPKIGVYDFDCRKVGRRIGML